MRVTSLTGGTGSGKSYVMDCLAECGATIVDTDATAHEITAPGGTVIPKLVETFGADILCSDGAIDRDAMRTLAFSDATARSRLEQITHPLVREIALSCEAVAQASGVRPCLVYVVPLLVKSLAGHHNRHSLIDRILVVNCSVDTQIACVTTKNGLPRAQVKVITTRQVSCGTRLAAADDVIGSNGTLVDLLPQTDRLDPTYRSS